MKKHYGEIIFLTAILLVLPINLLTWTGTKRITWNSGASLAPSSSIDMDGNFQPVWNDDTPGNDEIFHKALIYGIILEK